MKQHLMVIHMVIYNIGTRRCCEKENSWRAVPNW